MHGTRPSRRLLVWLANAYPSIGSTNGEGSSALQALLLLSRLGISLSKSLTFVWELEGMPSAFVDARISGVASVARISGVVPPKTFSG